MVIHIRIHHDDEIAVICHFKVVLKNRSSPEPIAKTINSGLTPVDSNSGNTIPAVVKPATVAEPTEKRISVAINHPINIVEFIM